MQKKNLFFTKTLRSIGRLKFLNLTALLIFLFLGLILAESSAQLKLGIWGDVGDSQVDLNGFTSISGSATYEKGVYNASLAYSTYFSQWKETVQNGLKLSIGRQNEIQKFDFGTQLFYLNKPISNQLFEWNLGFLLSTSPGNWLFNLGGHYREIRLKSSISSGYPDSKISEGFNLLYRAGYTIPICQENWNFKVTLTNYDHFLLLQETNPMMNISTEYLGFSNWNIFTEFWYRSAGFNNIQVHYYGYFFRLGGIWHLNW